MGISSGRPAEYVGSFETGLEEARVRAVGVEGGWPTTTEGGAEEGKSLLVSFRITR